VKQCDICKSPISSGKLCQSCGEAIARLKSVQDRLQAEEQAKVHCKSSSDEVVTQASPLEEYVMAEAVEQDAIDSAVVFQWDRNRLERALQQHLTLKNRPRHRRLL
jgi:hypothetical protein